MLYTLFCAADEYIVRRLSLVLTPLEYEHADHQLEVVLDPVVDFTKEQLLLLEARSELFLTRRTRPHLAADSVERRAACVGEGAALVIPTPAALIEFTGVAAGHLLVRGVD